MEKEKELFEKEQEAFGKRQEAFEMRRRTLEEAQAKLAAEKVVLQKEHAEQVKTIKHPNLFLHTYFMTNWNHFRHASCKKIGRILQCSRRGEN